MDAIKSNINGNPFADVNLKFVLKKILRRKWLFALSLAICLPIAYFYAKISKPIYECVTTIFVEQERSTLTPDPEMGDIILQSKKKQILANEIGIIKTHNMVKKSVAPLGFEVSYYAGKWYNKREKYSYFPFEVDLVDTLMQLYGVYFEVNPVSEDTYQLIVEADEFRIANPSTNRKHDIEQEFKFEENFKYGQLVEHEYFNFTIKKPDYKVASGAFSDQNLYFKLHTLEGLTNSFKGNLDVDQTDMNSSIIRMKTQGPVPKKQLMFLEELSKNYIQSKEQERLTKAANKARFIRIELNKVKDSLNRAEKDLENFIIQNQAVDLNVTTTQSLEQLQKLEAQKSEFDLNIEYYNQVLAYLSDTVNLSTDQITAPSLVGIDDPLLNENLIALKELYANLTKKLEILGPKSTELALIKEQIRTTTEQLKENLRQLISSAQLSSNERAVRISELNNAISRLPTQEKLRAKYESKSNRLSSLHEYLQRELAKTNIASAEYIATARILDAPRKKGSGPVAPQKKLIMVLGAMLGLLFPFLYVVLFDPYDEDISELKQLENYSNLPVVGSVAHFSSRSGLFSNSANSRWQVEESFRDVCTNVQILLPDAEHNIIGVTSTVPGEGKTFCALNISINLAASGKKVLLIDSDLRNSDLIQKIGVDGKNKKLEELVVLPEGSYNGHSETPPEDIVKQNGVWFEYEGNPIRIKGLLNYLRGDEPDLQKVIHQHKEEPNLDFIPASLIEDDNPHRLLADKRFELLIKETKPKYDYIIIDSPPVGLVSDYLLISKFIDLHLFVVRRNVSKFSYLKGIEKVKRSGQLKNCLLLFNDAAGKSLKYGYSNYSYGKVSK